jgi:DNA-binding NarL/FixJ family response regulator
MKVLKSNGYLSFESGQLPQTRCPDPSSIQDLMQLQQTVQHLGLIILDTSDEISWITPQAVIWLELYFTKPRSDLHLPDNLAAWVQRQPPQIEPTQTLELAPLCIERSDHCLTARLMRNQRLDRYSLLLEEQASTLELMTPLESLSKLGLSQRETEVFEWIMRGCSNKIIATQMSINVCTVRKHLEKIYAKLGVKSRGTAVSYVLSHLGML